MDITMGRNTKNEYVIDCVNGGELDFNDNNYVERLSKIFSPENIINEECSIRLKNYKNTMCLSGLIKNNFSLESYNSKHEIYTILENIKVLDVECNSFKCCGNLVGEISLLVIDGKLDIAISGDRLLTITKLFQEYDLNRCNIRVMIRNIINSKRKYA